MNLLFRESSFHTLLLLIFIFFARVFPSTVGTHSGVRTTPITESINTNSIMINKIDIKASHSMNMYFLYKYIDFGKSNIIKGKIGQVLNQ